MPSILFSLLSQNFLMTIMTEAVQIFKSKNLQNLDTQPSLGESIALSEQSLIGQETW